jgi:myo-inositol 2-dehydrogenase/D-chiro-inositol 1-dehydrogenase
MTKNIALIGAGLIGAHHARVLSKTPGVRIAAIIDLDAQRAAALAAEFGAVPAARVEDILPTIDAGYVLTPPRQRVEVIRTLAEAGKSIFCEKPMAATVEEGEQIRQIVQHTGVFFMMGFMRRYARTMVRLKEILRSGALGDITQVSYQRMGKQVPPAGNWRFAASALCGMTVESVSHDIDLLRWLFGDVDVAAGHVINTSGVDGYDDNMVATLKFASGAVGSLQVSWTSRLDWNSIGIFGSSGALMMDGAGAFGFDRLRLNVDGSAPQEIRLEPSEAADLGLAGENQAFAAAVAGNRPGGIPDVEDGLATLILSRAMTQSNGGVANRPG